MGKVWSRKLLFLKNIFGSYMFYWLKLGYKFIFSYKGFILSRKGSWEICKGGFFWCEIKREWILGGR